MRRTLLLASIGIIVLGLAWLNGVQPTLAQKKDGPAISHDVYFSLKDASPAGKKKLVDACKKYLSGHEGEVFYAAGARVESLKREVNDIEFDVALHIVFKDLASYDKYAVAPRHDQFIAENKDNWKKVRVFDGYAER